MMCLFRHPLIRVPVASFVAVALWLENGNAILKARYGAFGLLTASSRYTPFDRQLVLILKVLVQCDAQAETSLAVR